MQLISLVGRWLVGHADIGLLLQNGWTCRSSCCLVQKGGLGGVWRYHHLEISPRYYPLIQGGGLGKDPRHIVSEMLGNPVNRRTLGIACWRNRPSGECLYIIYFAMLACSCAAIWRTHLHRADFDKFVGPLCSLLLGSNARYCVGSTASGNVRSSAC